MNFDAVQNIFWLQNTKWNLWFTKMTQTALSFMHYLTPQTLKGSQETLKGVKELEAIKNFVLFHS